MVNWHGPKPARKFHSLVQEAGIEVESVSPRHVEIAIGALALYGVRFIYALAKPWDCGSFSAANSLTALIDKALGRVRRLMKQSVALLLAGLDWIVYRHHATEGQAPADRRCSRC